MQYLIQYGLFEILYTLFEMMCATDTSDFRHQNVQNNGSIIIKVRDMTELTL